MTDEHKIKIPTKQSPLTQQELVDRFFVEYRTRLLDIAAFLDRLDRASVKNAEHDFRLKALRRALQLLAANTKERTEKILMALSDPTVVPLEILDRRNAYGAFNHPEKENV